MRYQFARTAEGFVGVTLDDGLPLMREALHDSVGVWPPTGLPQDGPSTYWIDVSLRGLRARLEDGSAEPFASGNITYLQLREGHVEARYDYDDVDSDCVDRVPADSFLAMLEEWRQRLLDAFPDAESRMPPTNAARPMPPA